MIPGRESATGAVASTETGGACMLDVTGSGQMDLVLMQSGAQAIRVLHRASRREVLRMWMRRRRAEGVWARRGVCGG